MSDLFSEEHTRKYTLPRLSLAPAKHCQPHKNLRNKQNAQFLKGDLQKQSPHLCFGMNCLQPPPPPPPHTHTNTKKNIVLRLW